MLNAELNVGMENEMKRSMLLIGIGAICVAVGAWGARPRAVAAQQRPAQAATAAPSFAITNVRVFDGEKTIERATVLVRDGKIASVGAGVAPPPGTPT